ncbi:hypothetical protein GCM10027348_31740 [Hymenobacter tenuis]
MDQKIITTADNISQAGSPHVDPSGVLQAALTKGYTIASVTQSVVPYNNGNGVWMYRTWVLNPPVKK